MTGTAEEVGAAHVPWREVLTRAQMSSLLLVCLGVWLHAADALIVATMMPAIVASVGGDEYVAWSIALYEIGTILAGATGAWLTRRIGLRKPMGGAALIFAAGCLLSAVAPTMPVLLGGRLLQGVGGGGLTAMSFIAMNRLFAARYLARVMAVISVLWGGAAFLGPLVGGVFAEHLGWRWGFVFFGAQALALALWILLLLRLPPAAGSVAQGGRLPLGRLALLGLGILAVAWAGIGISPLRTSLLLISGLAALALFLAADARAGADRLLPCRPLDPRTPIGAAQLMNLAMSVATIALVAYGPLLMVLIHHASPTEAGMVLAVEAIAWTVAAFTFSGALEKRDPLHIAVGISCVAAGVTSAIWILPHGPLALIALPSGLQGFGFGLAWTFVLRRARRLTDPDDLDRLSGASSTIGHFGYAFGAALLGILANAMGFSTDMTVSEAAHLARGLFIGCLPALAVGLYATWRFTRRGAAEPAYSG
jgi:MFS family permease